MAWQASWREWTDLRISAGLPRSVDVLPLPQGAAADRWAGLTMMAFLAGGCRRKMCTGRQGLAHC
jgi:hypothetical protein